MKKLLLSLGACLAIATASFSQTTLFSEDFESGGAGVSLNTGDMGGSTATNLWILNNSYTGGSGDVICLGFPFAYSITNTSNQPAGITNSPNSTYMHIISQEAINDGIFCSSYMAADGLCTMDESNFSKMSSTISTVGMTNVDLDFWWLCGGGPTIFGEIYYSTDGGTTWILSQSVYNNQASWVQENLTDPAWDNLASLTFGFRFVNNTAASALDPGFGLDDIVISATPSVTNSITTGTVTPGVWCQGATTTLQVDFTSTGTFNPGNIYTAELSDALGSFAAPTGIGTLASTANSGIITAIVSGATPAGSGYRVRVVSSDPVIVGSDNGTDLVINPTPSVDPMASQSVCDGDATSAVNFTSTTIGTTFAWVNSEPSIGLAASGGGNVGSFIGTNAGAVPVVGTIVVTPTANGCVGASGQFTITVNPTPAVTFTPVTTVCEGSSPLTLAGGSPAGGVYSGTGVAGGLFDPLVAGVGSTVITYDYMDGNGCSNSAAQAIEVVALPTVTLQPFVDVCEGSAPVNLVGGSPSGGAYSGTAVSAGTFDPGAAGQGTTDVTYMYTDGNGCANSAVESITVIPSPAVSLNPFADVCDIDPFFTLTGGSPAGGTFTGPGVTGGVFDPMTAGAGTHTLTYSYTDGNGCTGEAFETIFVDICGSIGENGLNNFVLYPNPVSESFTLVSDLSIERVEVLDMSGRLVKSFNEQQLSYDVNEVPAGVYFVTIHTSEQISQLRIVVE